MAHAGGEAPEIACSLDHKFARVVTKVRSGARSQRRRDGADCDGVRRRKWRYVVRVARRRAIGETLRGT